MEKPTPRYQISTCRALGIVKLGIFRRPYFYATTMDPITYSFYKWSCHQLSLPGLPVTVLGYKRHGYLKGSNGFFHVFTDQLNKLATVKKNIKPSDLRSLTAVELEANFHLYEELILSHPSYNTAAALKPNGWGMQFAMQAITRMFNTDIHGLFVALSQGKGKTIYPFLSMTYKTHAWAF